MSSNNQELAIIVRLKDQASRQLKQVQGRMAGLATSVRRLYSVIAAGAGIYAMVRAFRQAIKEAIEFDKRLHDLWTLTDNTRDAMKELGKQVRFLALDFNVTGAKALTALYEIYSATFYANDAILILKESLKAAAAGISDVAVAADMFTTVLNAWGMAAEEVGYISDLMFATVKYGKTRFEELASQFGRLAGVAAPAGVAIYEMTAAIATLTRQGIATDWAITSLRQTLMQMLRPTEDMVKALKVIGVESGRALFETLGWTEGLNKIKQYAMATGVPLERLFTNVRAITAILPLLTTANKEYLKDLERQTNAIGMAEEAFEKQRKSISYQLGVMKTAMLDFGGAFFGAMFENVAALINDRVIPALKKAVFWVMENGDHLRFLGKQFLLLGKTVFIVFGIYKAFRLLMSPIVWLTAAAGMLYLAWELNLYKIKERVADTFESFKDIGSTVFDAVAAGIDFVFSLTGSDIRVGETLKNMPDLLKAALAAIVGLKVAGFLVRSMFGSAAALSGGVLTLPNLAVAAYLAWSVFNVMDKFEEGGFNEALDAAVLPIGGILGGILGAFIGHPIAGFMLGTAAGYAVKVTVKALAEINWDILNSVGEVSGDGPGISPGSALNPSNWVDRGYNWMRDLLGLQAGGNVPGMGIGDIIPAMLEPGEFVVPKWMMNMPEVRDMIESIWSSGPRMATGGNVLYGGVAGSSRSQLNAAALANLSPLTEQFPALQSAMGTFIDWLVDNMEVTGESTAFLMDFTAAIGALITPISDAMADFEQLQLDAEQFTKDYDEAVAELAAEMEKLAAAFNSLTLDTLASGAGLRAVDDVLETLRTGQTLSAGVLNADGELVMDYVDATLEQMVAAMKDAQSKKALVEGFLEFAKGIKDESAAIKQWIAPLEEMLAGFNEFLGEDGSVAESWSEEIANMIAVTKDSTKGVKAQVEAGLGLNSTYGQIINILEDLPTPLEGLRVELEALLEVINAAGYGDGSTSDPLAAIKAAFANNDLTGTVKAIREYALSSAGAEEWKELMTQIGAMSSEKMLEANIAIIKGNLDAAEAAEAFAEMLDELTLRASEFNNLSSIVDSGDVDAAKTAILEHATAVLGDTERMNALTSVVADLAGGQGTMIKFYTALGMNTEGLKKMKKLLDEIWKEDKGPSSLEKWGPAAQSMLDTAGMNKMADGLGVLMQVFSGNIPGAVASGFALIVSIFKEEGEKAKEEAGKFAENAANMANAAKSAASALWALAKQADSLGAIQSLLGDIQKGFISVFLGFLWPIAGVLQQLAGVFIEAESAINETVEEISEVMNSFNIPAGFKLLRAAYDVATPGQPWEQEDTTAGSPASIDANLTFIEKSLERWAWLLSAYEEQIQASIKPFKDLVAALKAMAIAIAPSILEVFLTILNSLAGPINALATWVTDVLTDDLIEFSKGFKKFWEDMVDPFLEGEFFPAIGEWLGRMYDWLGAILEFFADDAWDWLSTDVWGAVKPFVDAVLDMFEEFGKWVAANWPEIKDNLLEKIKAALAGLQEKLGLFLENVKTWLLNSPDTGEMSDWEWLIGVINGALHFLREVIDFIVDGLQFFGNILGQIMNAIIFPFNAFIALINGILGWAGVDIPLIPYFDWIEPSYHTGGIVGGIPGQEVIARLMPGEQVLTKSQQQNYNSGGSGDTWNVTVIANDPEEFERKLEAYKRSKGNRVNGAYGSFNPALAGV